MMEIDLDKEIDALLRRHAAVEGSPPAAAEAPAPEHLDADQVAAFAENALPEKTRESYLVHLADCGRCRKVLSGLILTSEPPVAVAAPAMAAKVAAVDIPWYRRLFTGQGLAYAMGGLVLVFAGFLGYSLLRTSGGGSGEVSQVAVSERPAGGPSAAEPMPTVSSSNAIANAANVAPVANSNAAAAASSTDQRTNSNLRPETPKPAAKQPPDISAAAPAGQTADTAVSPPAPPPPAGEEQEKFRRVAPAQTEERAAAAQNQTMGAERAEPPAKASRENRSLMMKQRSAAADEAKRGEGTRTVGGKTFESKQGVWYDASYDGRETVNVRRGTSEFKKLDAGLRSIADSLTGTVVVMWYGKAYRIQ